jgi:hypothetical protein
MRTTIRLSESLMSEAKRVAAEEGTTLTAVIEDSLREALARRRSSAGSVPLKLPVVHGRGPQRGVDLDDSAALLALMEGADLPS